MCAGCGIPDGALSREMTTFVLSPSAVSDDAESEELHMRFYERRTAPVLSDPAAQSEDVGNEEPCWTS